MASSNDEKQKNKKNKLSPQGRTNAYLFANLAIVGALLVGLWNKNPVWDATIRFPNILLLLVILNTVLIFRDVLKLKPTKGAAKQEKKHKTLWGLRKSLEHPVAIEGDFLKNALNILREIVRGQRVELHYVYPHRSELVAWSGEAIAQLNGNRMLLKDGGISVTYTGKLGSEPLMEANALVQGRGTRGFKSEITGLGYRVLSLNIAGSEPNERLAVLLFASSGEKARTSLPVALKELALCFELLLGLVEGVRQNEAIEYLDKGTGMELNSNFRDGLQTELERAERYEQSLGLLCLRISSFEGLSAEHKRLVHENVGLAIKQVLRRFDRVFLGEGGGEYFIILSESDSKESELVCNRIVRIFNKENDRLQPRSDRPLEMLVGAAVYPAQAALAETLLELSVEACVEKAQSTEIGAKQ
jgi:GGDEF domain-containing protein